MLNDRLHDYLKRLAAKDWGAPTGFGGHICFQAFPVLELERRGELTATSTPHGATPPLWPCIDYSLELLRQSKDCQDFAMVGLVRMLYRYGDSQLLTAEHRDEMTRVLIAAKYAERDSGKDSCCWHTENHQVQYASSELLLGQLFPDARFGVTGKLGRWHGERAREALYLWLDWRRRFSFSEWNSSCYYDDDLAAVVNIAEYAEDATLRQMAQSVVDQLVFHVALNSWRGITGASQGRSYLYDQIRPAGTPMSTLAQVCWGDVYGLPVPNRLSVGTLLLAVGDVRPAAAVVAAGRDCPAEMENRERHSLDADEAAAYGVHPDRQRDYKFFCGAGQDSHHLVVEANYVYRDGELKWPGFYAARDYYRGCKARGEAFDTWALPHSLGHADLYTFRTPEYMLGCAQSYHPGAPGYQQFIWCATLGERAVVFTTNPTPANIPYGRPGPWIGNGVLPKIVQHRNVLIALHRVRPVPIYDQPPWWREDRIHAWFPRGAFDEVIDRDGWCVGRLGDAYIGLRPNQPGEWLAPDPKLAAVLQSDLPYEWNVASTDVAWICELGARRTHGDFADFVASLAAARLTGDLDHLVYESPSLGRIETGWSRDLSVNGAAIVTRDYPRFANPYCNAPFGETAMVIRCADEECRIV